jgi:hypothetical protein
VACVGLHFGTELGTRTQQGVKEGTEKVTGGSRVMAGDGWRGWRY